MHDAQVGFEQTLPNAIPGDDVVSHNDVLGQNVVFRGGVPAALIDWELAAPGPRSVDLAAAAAWWVPLRPDDDAARHELPTERRPQRLRLLVDGYGLDARARRTVLDDVAAVWRSWHEAFRLWGGIERREGWRDAFDGGRSDYLTGNLRWLAADRHALEGVA